MDYPRFSSAIGKPAKPVGSLPLILRKGAAPLRLPVGTQFTATVLRQSSGSNFVKLLVGGKPLLAQSRESFVSGQTLKLEVTNAGKTPTLRILSAMGKHSGVRQTLMEALPKQIKLSTLYNDLFFAPLTDKKSVFQSALPRQTNTASSPPRKTALLDVGKKAADSEKPLTSGKTAVVVQPKVEALFQKLPLLQRESIKGTTKSPNISHVTTDTNNQIGSKERARLPPMAVPNVLPPSLKSLPAVLHPLFMNLLNRPNIKTPEGLKQAISNSGLFLEAKLLNDPDMEFTGDLKADFLKLKTALQQLSRNATHPEMFAMQEKLEDLQKKVEGAIARIVLNQIASSPTDDTLKQQWHIELPILQEDRATHAKLLITRDSRNDNGSEKDQWSIDLELEPKGLGRINSRIVYFDGEISTFFQCEHPATKQLIKGQLETLRQRFIVSGLNPGNLSAQHNENQSTETLSHFQGIVDEKA